MSVADTDRDVAFIMQLLSSAKSRPSASAQPMLAPTIAAASSALSGHKRPRPAADEDDVEGIAAASDRAATSASATLAPDQPPAAKRPTVRDHDETLAANIGKGWARDAVSFDSSFESLWSSIMHSWNLCRGGCSWQ